MFVIGGGTITAVTVVAAVDALFAGFGSAVDDDTFAVFVITVPFAVPPVTWTTNVKVAVAPFASVALVAVTLPVPSGNG